MENLEREWRAVVQNVCAHCIDADANGVCLLKSDEECGLRMHFPAIVRAIRSQRADDLQPYLNALRSEVCAHCKLQSSDGECERRSALDCGLDRYFALVVEAIEKTGDAGRGREGDRSVPPAAH